MKAQLPQVSYVDNSMSSLELASKVRIIFRKLGMFHVFRRQSKFYTFDVPFEFRVSKDGGTIFIVLCKESLPRAFPLSNLHNSKRLIQDELGVPIEIYEASGLIAVGCVVSRGD